MNHQRSTRPGQLTEGISLLHDYAAAAAARARQAARAREQDDNRPKLNLIAPTPEDAERDAALDLPDPFAYLDRAEAPPR